MEEVVEVNAMSVTRRRGESPKGLELLDSKQRKRIQNRIAQRKYRLSRAQKQRLHALEEVVAQAATQDALISPLSEDFFCATRDSSEKESPWSVLRSTDTSDENTLVQSEELHQTPSLDVLWDSVPCQNPVVDIIRTALHRAAGLGNISMCRLLLDRGADMGKHDSEGKTALHCAVDSGNEDLVCMMIDQTDPNFKDSLGRTALFSAVQKQKESIVRLLLNARIDVNSRDLFGEVVLHAAVDCGSEAIVSILLENGADVNA